MAYEGNDRRWGGGEGRYRGRADYYRTGGTYGRGGYGGRGPAAHDYDRPPSGYDYEDRGFFNRAGDEVRSWFGDEEAERRRRYDERYDEVYGTDWDRDERPRYYGEQDRWGARGYRRDRGYGGQSGGAYDADRQRGAYGDAERSRGDYLSSRGPATGDASYRSWRDRQMEAFDRDYEDYRRENQARFENEFSTYRTRRQSQRDLLPLVQEHAEVIGSDGQHVGTVDHVRGDRIQLTKSDQSAGGHHHTIPSSWLESVEGTTVKISKTADEAKRLWREDDGENRGALFGRGEDHRGDEGWTSGRNLERSFSGTY